jgi:hypothetical protein
MALLADHDRIQAIPETPGWSENLILVMHDAARGVAAWAHWGRVPGTPEVWEGVLVVYLPRGELLVHRSYGVSDLACSGPLIFRCDEPGRRWHASFDGMAQRTTTAEVMCGRLAANRVERLKVELTFDGLTPLWSPHGDMDGQTWASGHLEQAGHLTGFIEVSGESVTIETKGFRDHSYGPRDYSKMVGDIWCSAVFPSGKALLVFHVFQKEQPPLQTGFLWDGSSFHPIQQSGVPRLASADASPRTFDIEFDTDLGSAVVTASLEHCMVWTMDEPSALIPGAQPEDPRIYASEGPGLFSWNGESAAGWIERTLRPSEMI